MRRCRLAFHSVRFHTCLLLLALWVGALPVHAKETPEQRATAAQAMFDKVTKEYHLPSAEADGAAKEKLLKQAAEGYEQVLKKYGDQSFISVQALRSLANVRAAQGKVDEAVKRYAEVAKKHPKQDWEVLQAWKSAGDLLWDANRKPDAKPFYTNIVHRFDQTNAPMIFKTVVKGAKARLSE